MLHHQDHHHDADPGSRARDSGPLLRQGLLMLSLGVLLFQALAAVDRTHRRRHESRPANLPERLQTWEGEGGRPDPEAPSVVDSPAPAAPA